jgi:excisionase family DNA binding protein
VSEDLPYGKGTRMLTLGELCEWLNITERHARKLVEREAIPYRKVGRLLRFVEAEIEEWSRPEPRARPGTAHPEYGQPRVPAKPRRSRAGLVLPKSLIEWPTEQESGHAERRSA